MIRNYYDDLEIHKDSSAAQIVDNYRKLAIHWNPQTTQQSKTVAEHRFEAISEAYQVLSDPVKKSFYDHYGYQALKTQLFAQGALNGGYSFKNNPNEIMDNFFQNQEVSKQLINREIEEKGSIFSHAFGGLNYVDQFKPPDLIIEIPCTLDELFKGTSKYVNYARKVLCRDGRSTQLSSTTKLVSIKPGYNEKTCLHFAQEGHESVHRCTSDLYFKIKEVAHKDYRRQGKNAIYTKKICLGEALRCGMVDVPTLDGRTLKVSMDGIVSPKVMTEVEGEGFPGDGGRGNLYIRFQIDFPKQLSEEVKAQLRQILT